MNECYECDIGYKVEYCCGSHPETGEMIDEATAKIALMRVSKAYLAGLVDKEYLDLMAEKSKSITGYDILGSNE